MSGSIVVLTGGVGGAKLVDGLAQLLPGRVIAVVNTGDDFRHLGLAISPDLDTLLYTLSGNADPEQGWGRVGESWNFMHALRSLGGEDWFRLGDGDLALHVLRTTMLAEGATLSEVTAHFATAWGLSVTMLPMSDDPVATRLMTDAGELAFQDYFVRLRCVPEVRSVHFAGADVAFAAPGVLEAIGSPDTQAILIAPSNPWLSVDPVLAVPGIAAALKSAVAPVVAVSPLVGGDSVKGPTAKLMRELGLEISNRAIAAHYAGLLDGLLVDVRDRADDAPVPVDFADTLMKTAVDRRRVAEAALALAKRLDRR